MLNWFPQIWVEIQVRPEDYLSIPPVPLKDDLGLLDPVTKSEYLPWRHVIIPQQCSVSLRNYREADEARITLRYEQFPVDPRLLRSMTVKVFAGSLKPKEFADAMGPLGARGDTALLPEADPDSGLSNEIFRGFVDEVSTDFGEDNQVELVARDITGVFLDAEVQSGIIQGIPADTPIDEVIRAIIDGEPGAEAVPEAQLKDIAERGQRNVSHKSPARRLRRLVSALQSRVLKYTETPPGVGLEKAAVYAERLAKLQAELAKGQSLLAQAVNKEKNAAFIAGWPKRIGLPGARGIKVVNETGDDPMPNIGDIKATWTRSDKQVKKGRRGGIKSLGNATEKHTYWDFIVDLCVGSGYICYFRVPTEATNGFIQSAELVIANPRTYYPSDRDDAREFRAGLNIDSAQVTRAFAGENVPQAIGIRAESAETGEPISVVYPPLPKAPANRTQAKLQGVDRIEVRWHVSDDAIPGPDPEKLLTRQAQSIFEQLNKGEMSIKIDTECLAAQPSNLRSGNPYPDMLYLRPSDPVKFGVLFEQSTSGTNVYSTSYGKREAKPSQQRVQDLIRINGFPPALAAALVAAEENELLQEAFYVQDFDIEFDSESGFKFTVTAIEYLDARHQEPLVP